MPIGPPRAPEAFPDFESCVDRLVEEGYTEDEARSVCGSWESNAQQAAREFRANAPWDASDDPTSTKMLRARYSAEMTRRYRAIKGAIRTAVIENDVLGLGSGSPLGTTLSDGGSTGVAANVHEIGDSVGPGAVTSPGVRAFDYPTSSQQVDEFMHWLDTQVSAGVLEVTAIETGRIAAHSEWQNTYVRAAYRRGIEHAETAMERAGISPVPTEALSTTLRAPQHADALGLLFTRNFNELSGVTDAMADEMRRELAEGLAQGWNPRRTASALNDRVDTIGLNRSRMIARTETVRAVNEAALNRYEDFGRRLEGVTVAQEFSTAGDDRVCDICASMEGEVFSIKEARGVIPLHPSCRCAWLPLRQ